jgi:hypothetical protein
VGHDRSAIIELRSTGTRRLTLKDPSVSTKKGQLHAVRDSCSKMPFPNFPFQVFAKLIAAAMQARPGRLRVDATVTAARLVEKHSKPRMPRCLSLWINAMFSALACVAVLGFTMQGKTAQSWSSVEMLAGLPGGLVPST